MTSDGASPQARDALLRAAREELAERGDASVSLRAVARRAGVSHAAPAHFFGDRAGMLTAVATEGFRMLSTSLGDAARAAEGGSARLTALGRAYVDFGLEHPALIDLMFRRSELTPSDPGLMDAQQEALADLRRVLAQITGEDSEGWALISWALVHGLVTLAREGVLAPVAGRPPADAADLARELAALYTSGVAGRGVVGSGSA
ncbi:MAG: TetR/AcrR family transcriptional regulator [Microbacterium sp.]